MRTRTIRWGARAVVLAFMVVAAAPASAQDASGQGQAQAQPQPQPQPQGQVQAQPQAQVQAQVQPQAQPPVQAQGTVYVQPQYAQPYPQPVYAPPYAGVPPYAQPAAPRQTVTRTRPNLGMIISGAVLLGVGWITNIITGLPAGDDPFDSGSEPEWTSFRLSSLVPVVGPWIQLGVKPTSFEQDYWAPWLIIDGIMQTLGLTLLVIGIATPQTTTVVADNGDGFSLAIAPSVGPEHGGLALSGTF